MKQVTFSSVETIKDMFNIESIKVLINPGTKKRFCATGKKYTNDEGKLIDLNFKCQQDIDMNQPLSFIKDEDSDDYQYCLCNVKEVEVLEVI